MGDIGSFADQLLTAHVQQETVNQRGLQFWERLGAVESPDSEMAAAAAEGMSVQDSQ
eukprot:COSAG01_NODE_29927_length_626_cov_10.588235_1_plen_56_part_10